MVGLCGEDLTFTAVNLWMMSVNPAEISFVLQCSFAFNCMMLGAKLPEVLRLARLVLRKMRTREALEEGQGTKAKLEAARGRRRSSAGGAAATAAAAVAVADRRRGTWCCRSPILGTFGAWRWRRRRLGGTSALGRVVGR